MGFAVEQFRGETNLWCEDTNRCDFFEEMTGVLIKRQRLIVLIVLDHQISTVAKNENNETYRKREIKKPRCTVSPDSRFTVSTHTKPI